MLKLIDVSKTSIATSLRSHIIESQKKYFKSGKTKDINTRIDNLKKLLDNILLNEENIFNVLHKDLKKSNFESYLTEIAVLKSEVELVCKNLKKWSKPKKVKSTLIFLSK